MRCNCSICTKKGFLHLIVAHAQFELLSGADDLTVYTFNTGTAKHQFCRHCGIHPFYVPRSDPDKIDVNVRCLEGVDAAALAIEPFDGRQLGTGDRLRVVEGPTLDRVDARLRRFVIWSV